MPLQILLGMLADGARGTSPLDELAEPVWRAVDEVRAGDSSWALAYPWGNGARRSTMAALLRRLARCLDETESATARAAHGLRDAALAKAKTDDGHDRADREAVAASFVDPAVVAPVARARAAALARVAAVYSTDDTSGYRPGERDRATWSYGALVLLRRGAGRCLECGLPLAGRREVAPSGRTRRRDYCEPHSGLANDPAHQQREEAIESLLAFVGEALARDVSAREGGEDGRFRAAPPRRRRRI